MLNSCSRNVTEYLVLGCCIGDRSSMESHFDAAEKKAWHLAYVREFSYAKTALT